MDARDKFLAPALLGVSLCRNLNNPFIRALWVREEADPMRSQEEIDEVKALQVEMRELREAVEKMRDAFIVYYPHLDWAKAFPDLVAKREKPDEL